MSDFKRILLFLAYQESRSNVEIFFKVLRNEQSASVNKIEYFGFFGLWIFWREQEPNDSICQSISTSFKRSAETNMEDTKPLDTDKQDLQYWDETIFIALFGISEGQYTNARKKINTISIENICTTKNFRIETLMEEMKPVVKGDKWGRVGKSRKINKKWFYFGNFRLSGFWWNEQNQPFSPKYSSTSDMIQIEFLIEESELVVAEESNFEYSAK